jgi:hypothetical protein
MSVQERIMKNRHDDRMKAYEPSPPMSYRNETQNSPPTDYNNDIRVIKIQKKQYVNPGSSPEQRSGIEDINYQY